MYSMEGDDDDDDDDGDKRRRRIIVISTISSLLFVRIHKNNTDCTTLQDSVQAWQLQFLLREGADTSVPIPSYVCWDKDTMWS